jgi:PAS domain S-box-containing protein
LDIKGIIRQVNRKQCEQLGYDESELIGRPVWDFIAPGQRTTAQLGFEKKISGERFIVPFERDYLRADGSVLTVEVHDQLLWSAGKEVTGMRSAFINVTDRTRALGEASAAQTWMRSAFHSLPDGVITTDSLGTVKSMNTAAESATRWREYDAIGHPIEDIIGLDRVLSEEHPENLARGGFLGRLFRSETGRLELPLAAHRINSPVELSTLTDDCGMIIGTVVMIRDRAR